MRTPGRRWTEAEVTRAVTMRENGATYSVIARAVGRSISAVVVKFEQLSSKGICPGIAVVDVFWTIRELAAAGGEVTSARLRARGFAKHTVWRALADLRAAGLIVTAVAPVTCDRAIALTARGERAGKEDLKVRSRPQGRYWTEGETRRAERMREENHSAIEIAAALGRTVESVKAKLAYFSPRGAKGEGEPRPAVSAFALAQRERRCVAAGCRDLTAELMGDPPPGFSALDRKRAAEPKPETKRI